MSATGWARRRPRRGLTLPSVLVGLALTGLVLALLGSALVGLLRQAHRRHDRLQARAQLAQATGVLEAELRGATSAPSATDLADLLLVADTAVEVRAPVGGGVACSAGLDVVELLDAPIDGAPFVSWWSDVPQPDDVVHVHDEGATPVVADDAWIARRVAAVERGGSACASGPLGRWASAASPVRLHLDGPPLPLTVGAGAPVRVTRRRRYLLYRAADGSWQLGQRAWSGGAVSLQPVAGPLAPPTSAEPGLSVRAVDALGASVGGGPPSGAAVRLSVVVRAARTWAGQRFLDSSTAHVRLDAGTAP